MGGLLVRWNVFFLRLPGAFLFLQMVSSPAAAADIAVSISAGWGHTCALLSTGRVKCWGNNLSRQLGDGTTNDQSLTPVSVNNLSGVAAVAVSDNHTCALLSNGGRVKCWGDNTFGYLGNGMTGGGSTPVLVKGVSGATAIVAGSEYTCALLSSGRVKCWGDNSVGQLGDGTDTTRTTAVPVKSLSGVVALSAGYSHTCALLTTGRIKCWGSNAEGELGGGTQNPSLMPVAVKGVVQATSVAAGGFQHQHSCASLSNGKVKCWGSNAGGQLGNNSRTDSTAPVQVQTSSCRFSCTYLTGVASVTAGFNRTCAILNSGAVTCWDSNSEGQLGDGGTSDRLYAASTPNVQGITDATVVSAGQSHSCARLASGPGDLRCWGDNTFGKLGDATEDERHAPVPVSGF